MLDLEVDILHYYCCYCCYGKIFSNDKILFMGFHLSLFVGLFSLRFITVSCITYGSYVSCRFQCQYDRMDTVSYGWWSLSHKTNNNCVGCCTTSSAPFHSSRTRMHTTRNWIHFTNTMELIVIDLSPLLMVKNKAVFMNHSYFFYISNLKLYRQNFFSLL